MDMLLCFNWIKHTTRAHHPWWLHANLRLSWRLQPICLHSCRLQSCRRLCHGQLPRRKGISLARQWRLNSWLHSLSIRAHRRVGVSNSRPGKHVTHIWWGRPQLWLILLINPIDAKSCHTLEIAQVKRRDSFLFTFYLWNTFLLLLNGQVLVWELWFRLKLRLRLGAYILSWLHSIILTPLIDFWNNVVLIVSLLLLLLRLYFLNFGKLVDDPLVDSNHDFTYVHIWSQAAASYSRWRVRVIHYSFLRT